MLKPRIEEELNKQVTYEAQSSQIYLAMASWAETQGFEGVADFMYKHSDEERTHMLKLIKFINERGGHALVPALVQPQVKFNNLKELFESLLRHEEAVSDKINELVHVSLEERDYSTHNFLQWYVSEQLEEEALARTILDKLNLIGDESGSGLYMFDRDVANIVVVSANDTPTA